MCVNAQTAKLSMGENLSTPIPCDNMEATMPLSSLARVLSVDDDADAGEMLSLLLKSYGIEITCAHSAQEAWPLITAEDFDLYLLDAWLPQLDGFELCRQIRAVDRKTPVLFYSGAAYEADRTKGMAAGANAYVVKPDVANLIETMTALISTPKGVDESAHLSPEGSASLPGLPQSQFAHSRAA
jgi:DNA-binding response OmpR family regulator